MKQIRLKKIAILFLTICTFHAASAQTVIETDSTHFRITDMERFEGELFGGLALPKGESEYGTKIPKLTPFAGAGVGVYWCDGGRGLTVMPRVGVEYGDFVRLTFASQFSRQYYNNAQVSIGFVLSAVAPHTAFLEAYCSA